MRRQIRRYCVFVAFAGLLVVFTLHFTGIHACRWEHWPFVLLMIIGNMLDDCWGWNQ